MYLQKKNLLVVLLCILCLAPFTSGQNIRRCGQKLIKHVLGLCNGECYGDNAENLAVYGCAFALSNAELMEMCCPNGPSPVA